MAANDSPKRPHQPEARFFSSFLGEQVLAHAQAGREVVQDFCPLADSLEWELGQQYLKERGNKAFISDASPVPFVVNNDGTLSRNAAEVFFTSLVEAQKAGTLEEDIFVLELGIGFPWRCLGFNMAAPLGLQDKAQLQNAQAREFSESFACAPG